MWKWLKNRTNPQEKPADSELRGAPSSPRTKTYSANTGYVYQYVYRGYRMISDVHPGMEYVFSATRDRAFTFRIAIRLLDTALEECSRSIGREVLHAERYALAKMALFEALDHAEAVEELQRPLTPDGEEMAQHLRVLGRV